MGLELKNNNTPSPFEFQYEHLGQPIIENGEDWIAILFFPSTLLEELLRAENMLWRGTHVAASLSAPMLSLANPCLAKRGERKTFSSHVSLNLRRPLLPLQHLLHHPPSSLRSLRMPQKPTIIEALTLIASSLAAARNG